MATQSWLLTVSVLIEQDEETLQRNGRRSNEEFRQAVTDAVAALYAGRTDTVVEWQSLSSTPLDDKPGTGRCAVCHCWVYDLDNCTPSTPTRISRGAVVDGRYFCDEHLRPDHPHCFGRGYTGPIPPEV